MTRRDEKFMSTLGRMSMTTDVSPLAAALLYASFRWPVLPLHTPDANGVCDCHKPEADNPDRHPIGKHPRTIRGADDATTDPDTLRHWWKMWPNANIAIALAGANLVDVAPDSVEWYAEFVARGLPPTLSFASGAGEGHQHWLYARPEGCPTYRDTHSGQYDLMSAGYAVMPPSLHRSGRRYTWLTGGVLL